MLLHLWRKRLLISYCEISKWNSLAPSCLRILEAIWVESSLERVLKNGLHYFNEREQDLPLQKGLP